MRSAVFTTTIDPIYAHCLIYVKALSSIISCQQRCLASYLFYTHWHSVTSIHCLRAHYCGINKKIGHISPNPSIKGVIFSQNSHLHLTWSSFRLKLAPFRAISRYRTAYIKSPCAPSISCGRFLRRGSQYGFWFRTRKAELVFPFAKACDEYSKRRLELLQLSTLESEPSRESQAAAAARDDEPIGGVQKTCSCPFLFSSNIIYASIFLAGRTNRELAGTSDYVYVRGRVHSALLRAKDKNHRKL